MKKILVLSLLCFVSLSFTAPQDDALKNVEDRERDISRDLKTQEDRARQDRIENSIFRNDEPSAEVDSTENGAVFFLSELEITDIDNLLTQNEEFFLKSKYLNRSIGIRELNELINKANGILVKKGFITSRVTANIEGIQAGKLSLEVISGKIDGISLNGNGFSDRAKMFLGKPVRRNNILNIRDIDTLTDNFNRNSSNNFAVKIEPSKKEGYSRIAATNEVKGKTTISLGYNNYGDEDGGKNRAKFGLSINSPFGINDFFSFSIQTVKRKKADRSWKIAETQLQPGQIAPSGPVPNYDPKIHGLLPPRRKTNLWSFAYSIPVRNWSLSLGANKSTYEKSMYTYNTVYDLSGSSTSLTAGLSRIVYRNNKSKLVANIGVTRKNNRSYFEDVELYDRNLSIGTMGLDYDFSFIGGIAGAGISYSKGLRIFHAERDEGKGGSQAKSEAERTNFSLYWYKPVKNFTFRVTMEGQYSKDVNYSTEKMTIGGMGSVPGYQSESISGDSGYSVVTELSYTFRYDRQKLVPYITYGTGETENRKDSSPYRRGRVKGGSIGIRYSGTYIDIDVAYARAFGHSSYLKPKNHEVYAGATLKYSF